ncbi:TetR/AcrR family transcriptional regulator [Cellulomonas fimi]|uniref:TetR/AcrR family transcriptional regulator n=1 Tax=Cellulomonas fimi TaxID=1708 RepID=A0A7Y0LVR2_CELFI|nr:TetR/AcrR family transcriptional regulator [Cellulomonas fimi]
MPRAAPRTARGNRTRARLVESAEQVFADVGYHDASIVKITEHAGVGLGTFYLYFDGKLEIFDEVVEDLNRRVRHAMAEATEAAPNRIEAERAGFRAFFRFTAEHPALYRIVRQAEFVSPAAFRMHYTRIVEGYIEGLTAARASGEIGDVDPTVAAWVLMGIGELVGMRWVRWAAAGAMDSDSEPGPADTMDVPPDVFDQVMGFIQRGLAAVALDRQDPQDGHHPHDTDDRSDDRTEQT